MRIKAIGRCGICDTSYFRELFDLCQLHSCGVIPRQGESNVVARFKKSSPVTT